ncbi:hypothetical protein KP509_29G080100 [Ceratopteris richardii]|uniref:Uncharacterized protein n=1 Tax=Ceratopteris richardii TaxID=49495 RepID=A0A8T2RA38_CERRI|nr:hypothetical protein KP509_29G080100 [Ceratopteris richardii]
MAHSKRIIRLQSESCHVRRDFLAASTSQTRSKKTPSSQHRHDPTTLARMHEAGIGAERRRDATRMEAARKPFAISERPSSPMLGHSHKQSVFRVSSEQNSNDRLQKSPLSLAMLCLQESLPSPPHAK